MPLADGRWFALELTQVTASASDIERARAEMRAQAPPDVVLGPEHRAIFLIPAAAANPPTIIEVAVSE
jgi:hypothetical protein